MIATELKKQNPCRVGKKRAGRQPYWMFTLGATVSALLERERW